MKRRFDACEACASNSKHRNGLAIKALMVLIGAALFMTQAAYAQSPPSVTLQEVGSGCSAFVPEEPLYEMEFEYERDPKSNEVLAVVGRSILQNNIRVSLWAALKQKLPAGATPRCFVFVHRSSGVQLVKVIYQRPQSR